MEAQRVVQQLELTHPVDLKPFGGEAGQLLVAEQSGRILRVHLEGDLHSSEAWLDLSDRIACCSGRGLWSVALEPQSGGPGGVWVLYTPRGTPDRLRLSRFPLDSNGGAPPVAAEQVVVETPHQVTADGSGGRLLFGPDGMLYVALSRGRPADEASDPLPEPRPWSGSVLRIAVDDDGGYGVPPDNPETAAGVTERWAWGLRHPLGCSFDAEGRLWCSDVGERLAGEINLVRAGGDYGWPRAEGTDCRGGRGHCQLGELEPSLDAYTRQGGHCGAVGGVVYAGAAQPHLDGVYLYGDRCSGELWGMRVSEGAAGNLQVSPRQRLGQIDGGIAALGADASGELYALGAASGHVLRLVVPDDGIPGTFPERLSETGCYADTASQVPGPDLIPYGVGSPLWSDGALKQRYMVIPPGETIDNPREGAWQLPVGSVLIKEFWFETERGNPETKKPIETRIMVRYQRGWEFHSYEWNDAGTDGELLDDAKEVDVRVRGAEPQTIHYLFPSRFSCTTCHSQASGLVLGPRTGQLNSTYAYPDGSDNQLAVLSRAELLANAVDPADGSLPSWADPADAAPSLETRARSYLAANCAHCHRPGGWTPPDLGMDLRFERSLAETGLCDVRVRYTSIAPGRYRIAAGSAEDSALWQRMQRRDLAQMPPLATSVVDPVGVDVVRRWIDSLSDCPDPPSL